MIAQYKIFQIMKKSYNTLEFTQITYYKKNTHDFNKSTKSATNKSSPKPHNRPTAQKTKTATASNSKVTLAPKCNKQPPKGRATPSAATFALTLHNGGRPGGWSGPPPLGWRVGKALVSRRKIEATNSYQIRGSNRCMRVSSLLWCS